MAALMNGADDGVRQAQQSAVDSDNAALASAQAAFAALGASNAASLQNAQSQVESIQAQINTAQAQIASADAALANLSGTSAADASGHGLTATYVGSPTLGVAGSPVDWTSSTLGARLPGPIRVGASTGGMGGEVT